MRLRCRLRLSLMIPFVLPLVLLAGCEEAIATYRATTPADCAW